MPVARFKFTSEFLLDAFRHHQRQHSAARFMALAHRFSIGLCVVMGTVMLLMREWETALFFLVLVLILVSMLLLQIEEWVIRRQFRKSPFRDEDLTIEITEECYRGRSATQDARFQWPLFTRVVHFRDGFLLYQGPSLYYWLPSSVFEGEADIAELEALLRAKIANHRVIEPCARAHEGTGG
ncbi:MAG: YcxB family protein [Candidatus Sumerlaeia bacterium]|nr:YcxB family protein [Candidatus Sumerlaeia bacterium]